MKTNANGWQVKSLGKVARLIRGVSYDNSQVSKIPVENYIPIFRANNINDGLLFDDLVYVPSFLVKEDQLIRNGDILIAMSSGSKNIVGKTTQAKSDLRYSFGAFCGLLRPSSVIDSKYLGFYFRTKNYRSYISNSSRGANINNLRKESFETIQISFPPLPIQKQIAAILEKADEAKQKRKEANKLTDEFLQSVFIEMFGDPVNNPKGWDKIELGEVISILMDYHSNGSYETLRNNVKLLNTPDYAYMVRTTDLEKQDYETDVKYVSKSSYEFLKKSKIFGGEIIINKIGSAGQVYLMPYLNRKVSLGMNQFGLRFNDKANNIYIYFLLKSSYGESIIQKKVQGAVTKTITKEAVRNLIVPLPPLPLQQQFAEIVNKTETLKEKQKQSEQELENLFQSLMQKAFKGGLVS